MFRRNKYEGEDHCYFSTYQTVDWVDVFIRPVYKQVVVHTLNHFIKSKGLVVYSWCLMSHHLHLLAESHDCPMAELEKEFKLFTTRQILEAIDTEPEIRRDWMLKRFESLRNRLGLKKKYYLWQNSSNPLHVDLNNTDHLISIFNQIHQNPVQDKIVDLPGEYLYSSARDYAGMKGLVHINKLRYIAQQLSATESMKGNFFVKYVRN